MDPLPPPPHHNANLQHRQLAMDDLPPSAFTASSSVASPSYGRLHFPLSAWVARGGQGEYLQISLVNKNRWENGDEEGHTVTGVATQGHPVEPWWVTRYTLQYTADFMTWVDYNRGEVQKGNTDNHQLCVVTCSPTFKAVAIRFTVVEHVGRQALRVGVQSVSIKDTHVAGPGEQLKVDLLKLVNADEYADVAVIVQSGREQRTILGHKCILASRSSYFADALRQCERQQNRSKLTQLVIENIVPPEAASSPSEACRMSCEIMLAVLTYIYTSVPPPPHLLYAVGRVAHQLHLGRLSSLTETVLLSRARDPDTCAESFTSAFKEGRSDVQHTALHTIKTHWKSINLDWEKLCKDQILLIISAVEGT
eukprot:TRINITY_DN37195_c0_g1_i1.p1 TRINITY_DN37195_c0_g1~~TRINITY_DN37195_c0_g1_i1.p1  ORF type:complete len:366 (+),score=69.06 TRINITY_DN37195_c0_g1_i1:54-1151(+)